MGFLRKVGRKISKKLGKIFGSKLGAVVGAVGLYMLMGPVAKSLTGWAQSAFGIGKGAGDVAAISEAAAATTQAVETSQIAAGTDAISTELAKTIGSTGSTASATAAGASSGAQALAAAGKQSVGADALLTEQSLLAGETLATQAASRTASSLTVDGQIANMTNNMDIANSAIAAIDSAAITGSTNVYPTITDSLINEAIPALDQTVSTVKSNVASINQVPDSLFEEDLFADAGSNLVGEPGATLKQMAENPTKFARLQEGATFGEKIGRFASDPIGLTTKGATNLASSAIEGVTSGEFVGDTVQGVTTGLIMGELQGDYEEPFRSAGVASQPISEAAQGNYIQAVSPSAMAATGMTRPLNFQELSRQTLYGTGSSNYLSQFYQPLSTPQAIG